MGDNYNINDLIRSDNVHVDTSSIEIDKEFYDMLKNKNRKRVIRAFIVAIVIFIIAMTVYLQPIRVNGKFYQVAPITKTQVGDYAIVKDSSYIPYLSNLGYSIGVSNSSVVEIKGIPYGDGKTQDGDIVPLKGDEYYVKCVKGCKGDAILKDSKLKGIVKFE